MDGGVEPCVLLSCAGGEAWAVPQSVLAGLRHCDHLPEAFEWCGSVVPVLDLAAGLPSGFGGPARGDLLAVFRGSRPGLPFWALRLSPPGARWQRLSSTVLEDCAVASAPDTLALFHYQEALYRVPDLEAIEARLCMQSSPAS